MKMIRYREIFLQDYDKLMNLWGKSKGIKLRSEDNSENIERFLLHNPGICFVALNEEDEVIGSILCGYDGKRGYVYHLAVDKNYRRNKIASNLVLLVKTEMKKRGVPKLSFVVIKENLQSVQFWLRLGAIERTDLSYFDLEIY